MKDKTLRLTVAQALVRYLTKQMAVIDGERLPIVAGMLGDLRPRQRRGHRRGAAISARDSLPTFRAHNEQAMAHGGDRFRQGIVPPPRHGLHHLDRPRRAQHGHRRGVAHVNRLPVLLLPGDVFANRGPDPVLQQVEDFADGTVSANDCFRPVSRYFDRISDPSS